MSPRSHLATAAELSPFSTTEDVEFLVTTYNVLAQCYIDGNRSYYNQHCPDHLLTLPCRVERIMRQLDECRPDVICLQEVDKSAYDMFYGPGLARRGFDGYIKLKTGCNRTEGVATFYRRSKFTCLTTVPVEYRTPGFDDEEHDQVALILVLAAQNRTRRGGGVIGAGGRVVVGNTHLLFDARLGDVKLAQTAILLAALDRVAGAVTTEPGSFGTSSVVYDPVILCGDFNADPSSELFRFVIGNSIVYDGLPVGLLSGSWCALSCVDRSLKRPVGIDLFPKSVAVTDRCQLVSVVSERARLRRLLADGVPPLEVRPSKLLRDGGVDKDLDDPEAEYARGTGVLTQRFQFESSQREYTKCNMTTWLNSSCTGSVSDYVFFSGGYDGGDCESKRLILIGASTLPCIKDFRPYGGMPNEYDPSDHVMTSASFRLKVN